MTIFITILMLITLYLVNGTTLAETFPILIWIELITLTYVFVYSFCRPIKRHIIFFISITTILLEYGNMSAKFPILRLFVLVIAILLFIINNKTSFNNR